MAPPAAKAKIRPIAMREAEQRAGSRSAEMRGAAARACALASAHHRQELCLPSCALWEPGGAALEADCLVERAGFDLGRSDIAHLLLEVRTALSAADDPVALEEGRTLLRRLLEIELEDDGA